MKKAILITSILVTIFSCKTKSTNSFIIGNWYGCTQNGDYIEMHVKGNLYKYSTDFSNPTNWNKFEIKSDTLIQYDKFMYPDSINVNKAILKFSKSEELKLKYFISGESLTLSKLDDKIENIENNILLKIETIERSKKVKCSDLRTEKERKKDSLNKIIEFKF